MKAILAREPVRVFNHGDMRRDFTNIDDITSGIVAVADDAPASDGDPPAQSTVSATIVPNRRCAFSM